MENLEFQLNTHLEEEEEGGPTDSFILSLNHQTQIFVFGQKTI
jgi:hypothetical protein